MTDIFISYAHDDRPVAARLATHLHEQGWEVFWDYRIEAGARWNDEIQRALRHARCVLVLWSATSRNSLWVVGEAANSFERGCYFPVRIDESKPPKLFQHHQVQSICQWVARNSAEDIEQLDAAIKSRIGVLPMYGNLEQVTDDQAVGDAHLHLVHSCWRVDKKTSYGLMPYQIHLIVYGHPSALARIESVEYHLPGYPDGHNHQPGGPRERLFELKELANGFSIAQADIHLRFQPAGHSKKLRLSRFINMSETGPRLFDDYIRRFPLWGGGIN